MYDLANVKPLTLSHIRANNAEAGRHYFDKSTTRFFKSRYIPSIYRAKSNTAAYILHADTFEMQHEGANTTRTTTYKVARADFATGDVRHAATCQTLDDARDTAKRLASEN